MKLINTPRFRRGSRQVATRSAYPWLITANGNSRCNLQVARATWIMREHPFEFRAAIPGYFFTISRFAVSEPGVNVRRWGRAGVFGDGNVVEFARPRRGSIHVVWFRVLCVTTRILKTGNYVMRPVTRSSFVRMSGRYTAIGYSASERNGRGANPVA